MKLTLSTILALSALALSIPVAELRKRDLGGNHTEEECEKAFESLKQDEKTKDYDFKNLFWVPMGSVCSKVDVVIYGSKILSKHCTQTVNEDSPFQSAAIYEAWSNTEAALGACQMSSESRYCVDEVLYSSMDVDTLTKEFTQLANIAANCTCTQVNSLGNTCNTCLTTQNLTTVSSSNLLFNLIGNCNTSATAIPKTVKLFETIWGINATTNFNKQTVEKVSTTSANPPAETAQIVKPSSAAYKSISVTFTFLMSALIFTL
ncbi:hypothetical protein HK099_001180 [Clydaea vesicula]|uniref:Uncharacterized protein n=1 Tax=Clydaea vesicula TaxID=447962 RepID=A0AAD5XXB4_9FUNG|nr:hypothetical protein HK099_001180 [Clydaea vesicula]